MHGLSLNHPIKRGARMITNPLSPNVDITVALGAKSLQIGAIYHRHLHDLNYGGSIF
jgi:hypothetical protein